MYNYQQHEREAKLLQECAKIHSQYNRLNKLYKTNNPKMSTNHARRVDAFALSSLGTPVHIDVYKPNEYQPRPISNTNSNAIQHPMPFRINHHTAQERINDINIKTKQLDSVPFRNTSQHQFRDLASATKTKSMRLNASSSVFRVYESLMKNRSNEINVNDSEKMRKQFRTSETNNLENNAKLFHKTLTSDLHRKTYFNSLRTLAMRGHSKEREGGFEKISDFEEKQKKNNKENIQESANRCKNAIEALTKCGYFKKKHLH